VLVWQERVLMIICITFLAICTYWLSHRLSDLCVNVSGSGSFSEAVEHLLDATVSGPVDTLNFYSA